MGRCLLCGKESREIASILNLCQGCIRNNFSQVQEHINKIHQRIKEKDGVLYKERREGLSCNLCVNNCVIGEGLAGFCGLRRGREGKLVGPTKEAANLEYYFDSLPTNCVAAFGCAATGCGWPQFSYSPRTEFGYKNLAVFFNGCSFNCLFCQNYQWHDNVKRNWSLITIEQLLGVIDNKTSCICFFGGDPSCQIDFTINFSQRAIREKRNQILRICWETNGSFSPKFREAILDILLCSGGTIKFDLKFLSESLNIALCGRSNKQTLDNFSFFAKHFSKRKTPPLVCASTLIIPGYIDREEVGRIARFIAEFHSEIPYSLLGFWPAFYLEDLPRTSKDLMYACYNEAVQFLKRVNIGNKHLLC